MAQVTSGIRSILSNPFVYDSFQNLLGAERHRRLICSDYIRPGDGGMIVDVGCGTAMILQHLPNDVRYFGFDLSPAYIDAAKARYGMRGTFMCRDITQLSDEELPQCDTALAIGLLHHLDDADATALIAHLYKRLAPGGRLITVDPAYWEPQSMVARFLISRDRGQNVRDGEAYKALVPEIYSHTQLHRRDDLLHIPYSHAVLECTK
ncbi:hypothetical protein AZ78_4142 [Lysobacter capsici AZ78]|uniref:Methyltransferase domain-containing protein n=1 Tax=Lysobacter capsici AZ78 TaxID=1444315 RepID=A0A108UCA5_9GAMM|nr:class I SAM-dependent methyltransferase [Lysobacter capsici]ATE73382.1 class I SAM-dependent methyltransferase [Lysobacter capsici]KWS06586.1 hypothetical protein AZ78_4142 [Lysobacter capsici AZ78]